MARALIVFLSLGGTTSRVARHISEGLRQVGIDADLLNLARPAARPAPSRTAIHELQPAAGPLDDMDIADYDLLGVGSPVHYYGASQPVMRFLRSLPRLDGRDAFTFTLYGTYPGRTARELRIGLQERGATHLGAFSCHGAEHYVAYLRKGYQFSAGHPNQAELAAAKAFGEQVARGSSIVPLSAEDDVGWVYRFERLLAAPALTRQVYSRLFRVDRRRCTGCGACARRCPVGNITLDPDRRPHWGRECILCLYCEMICPEEAITSPIGLPPFDTFVTHNVRVAAADTDLDYARVAHERGRTRLLGEPTPGRSESQDAPGG